MYSISYIDGYWYVVDCDNNGATISFGYKTEQEAMRKLKGISLEDYNYLLFLDGLPQETR